MSDWFFQMVFCATAMSIVSGTIAERIKLVPFLIFAIFLTGIIYPIQGSWTWGGGWLSEMGFSDFAGSTIVHSVGGWAALTGALIIGPRIGKYGPNGQVNAIPGSNLPLATIGTFILWFGWFGFNGGSQLALGSAADAAAIANVYVNTNMAACAGLVAALVLSILLYKKTDLTFVLNGALAGLVAITAGPDVATPLQAMIIGAIGGILTTLAIPLLDKVGVDDVVGAISVHLVSGIWGTLAVAIPGLNGSGDMGTQIIGILAIGIFTVILSAIGWFVLKAIYGLRPTKEEENVGLDISELGMDAYPEFKN
jgi:Amt family ammonium transporter